MTTEFKVGDVVRGLREDEGARYARFEGGEELTVKKLGEVAGYKRHLFFGHPMDGATGWDPHRFTLVRRPEPEKAGSPYPVGSRGKWSTCPATVVSYDPERELWGLRFDDESWDRAACYNLRVAFWTPDAPQSAWKEDCGPEPCCYSISPFDCPTHGRPEREEPLTWDCDKYNGLDAATYQQLSTLDKRIAAARAELDRGPEHRASVARRSKYEPTPWQDWPTGDERNEP